jgi:hypothetical protein
VDNAAVTHRAGSCGVQSTSPRVGVCVVRVETRTGAPLVTLRMNSDIEGWSIEEVRSATDLDVAIAAIRYFLVDFARRTGTEW